MGDTDRNDDLVAEIESMTLKCPTPEISCEVCVDKFCVMLEEMNQQMIKLKKLREIIIDLHCMP